MMPLIPLLILPLAMIISLLLNSYGNWAFTALEQTRLDALTLSLCHHRKNFIEESIQKQNKRIRAIQRTMDIAVLSCLGASALGRIEVCAATQKLLRFQSKTGKLVESFQNIKRKAYPLNQLSLVQKLSRENELNPQFGSLYIEKSNLLIHDGFQREKTGKKRQIWEKIFRTQWPQALEETEDFPRYHNFKSRFSPVRTLVSISPKSIQWHGLKSFKHRIKKGSPSTTYSGCKIAKGIYKVRRLH